MRKLFGALVLLLGVLFILNYSTELDSLLDVTSHADWRFLALAIAVQGLWFFAMAGTLAAVYRALGRWRRILPMVPIVAAANFANVVAPSVGMSGMAVLMVEARRQRQSGASATVAGALYVLCDYLAFIVFLIGGLVVLFRRGELDGVEIGAASFLILSTAVLAGVLYLGMRSARRLARVLKWAAGGVNKLLYRFIKRDYFEEARAETFAQEIAEGLEQLRDRPANVLPAIFFSFSGKLLRLLIMLLVFLAFKAPFSAGTLLVAYVIAILFLIVSPTPAGIGVVEGALALTLVSFGLPVGQSTVLVLAYRGVTFWLPLFLGMIAFNMLSLSTNKLPQQPT